MFFLFSNNKHLNVDAMESETTKSIVVKKFGNYDALNVEQMNLPPLGDKIEIEVAYGGINFADLYTRQGLMSDKKLPFVLGMECAGTITAIGSTKTSLKVGQRVICYDYQGGLYREKVRVDENKCYPIPEGVPIKEAAAIFVSYVTAYFSILELGNLRKNQNVLLLSCGGGVGIAATQLAKTVEGVKIFGTASSDKHQQVRDNGVDVTLTLDENFQKNVIAACPDGFDLIISNQAGPIFTYLQGLLRPLGRIVLIGANNLIQNEQRLSRLSLIKAWLTTKNVSLGELVVQNRVVAGLHLGTLIEKNSGKVREVLGEIFRLVEEKKINVKIHAVYPMDEIVEATKVLAKRKNVGKVLISMKNSSLE